MSNKYTVFTAFCLYSIIKSVYFSVSERVTSLVWKSRDIPHPGPFCGNGVNRKAGDREWRVVRLLNLGNILKLSNQTNILFRLFWLIFNGTTRIHREITELASISCPKQKAAWSSSGKKSRANSTRPVRQRWAVHYHQIAPIMTLKTSDTIKHGPMELEMKRRRNVFTRLTRARLKVFVSMYCSCSDE